MLTTTLLIVPISYCHSGESGVNSQSGTDVHNCRSSHDSELLVPEPVTPTASIIQAVISTAVSSLLQSHADWTVNKAVFGVLHVKLCSLVGRQEGPVISADHWNTVFAFSTTIMSFSCTLAQLCED